MMSGSSPAPILDRRTVGRVIEAAVAAPSILNCQPWRFRADADEIHAFVVPERAPAVDPTGREVHLSVGAAVLNLRLALAAEGMAATVQLMPSTLDPRLVATVRVVGPANLLPEEAALFEAVPRRRTSRLPFTDTPIPFEDLDWLEQAAAVEGTRLEHLTGLHRSVVVGLLKDADLAQRDDPRIVQDAALWTVDRGASRDAVGIPAEMLGPSASDPSAVVRDLAFGRAVPGRPAADFETDPRLAVLLTTGDQPADWVRGGMGLERVLLEATSRGICVGLLSQAAEVTDLRSYLRDPMSSWRHPQVVMRLGYGQVPPATPRLPVDEVLEVSPQLPAGS
jgi:hypothetical protein